MSLVLTVPACARHDYLFGHARRLQRQLSRDPDQHSFALFKVRLAEGGKDGGAIYNLQPYASARSQYTLGLMQYRFVLFIRLEESERVDQNDASKEPGTKWQLLMSPRSQ